MEEEPEGEDLTNLDLLRLEAVCLQKDFSEIPPKEIEILEGVLTKAQQNKYLAIQAGCHWDGKKIRKTRKNEGAKRICKGLSLLDKC